MLSKKFEVLNVQCNGNMVFMCFIEVTKCCNYSMILVLNINELNEKVGTWEWEWFFVFCFMICM